MDQTAPTTLFAWLDREIWLVTTQTQDRRRGGLIATFVNQASIVPACPRVLVGLGKKHRTWELVEVSQSFTLHLLGEQHIDQVWRFGLQSGRNVDKFTGLDTGALQTTPLGHPLLNQTVGWLDCRVESRLDTGDRTVYLAEVLQGEVLHFGPPLTLKRLLAKAPPEYLAELKRQMQYDSLHDAEAIHSWRESMNKTPDTK